MGTGWEWFDELDPETRKALLLAGANFGSAYYQDKQADERADEASRERAISNKQEGLQQLLNSETSDYRYNTNRNDSNAQAAARMAGSSPLQHHSQATQMRALGDILGGAGRADLSGLRSGLTKHMPNGGAPISTTPFSSGTMAMFDPTVMAKAAGPYYAAQNNIDPDLESPDLAGMGYGEGASAVTNDLNRQRSERLDTRAAEDKAYEDKANARRAALEASLSEMGPDAQENANGGPDQDDGGIDWKKWAGIGAGAAGGYFLGGRG